MKTYQVKVHEQGKRLDIFLLELLSNQSRSFIGQQIKSGQILVNGTTVKSGYIIKSDDEIYIEEVEPKALDLTPVKMNLDVVYEDDDLMVINKPSGLVVHPASSYHEPTLVHALLFDQDHLSSINGVIRPGIVHRIDKDTSGLLVVAKNDLSHQALSEDLKNHLIKREYIALVYGHFEEKEGVIDAPIKRNPKNRLKMAVIKGGKEAITHFKVIKSYDQYTLIRCELKTGRTHQIRVHMAYIKHPVVGDYLYGPKDIIGEHGQYLHAQQLTLTHPTKKETMTFKSDIPSYFQAFIDSLK